jgi:hypothetical protein
MRRSLQAGNRVQLNELGRRGAKKQTRTGTVLTISRSGTQCRVRWDDVRSPQLIHFSLLELVPPEHELSGAEGELRRTMSEVLTSDGRLNRSDSW